MQMFKNSLFRSFPINSICGFSLICLFIFGSSYTSAQDLNENSIKNDVQGQQIELLFFGTLVPIVILFAFGFFIFYRHRRETFIRERELELKLSKAEMEMRALRAQVNPHFIFNCLNSIQHYIHTQDNINAEKYLVKFSRLVRQVLEQSNSPFITLDEDISTLSSYIDLERLRMNQRFNYEIILEESLDREKVYVPPMLLQPIVENSIWHGLNNRSSNGLLQINFKKNNDQLICEVTDNGIPNPSISSDHKGKSFGLNLIKDRLDLLTTTNCKAEIFVKDVVDSYGNIAGKMVRLIIPYEEE